MTTSEKSVGGQYLTFVLRGQVYGVPVASVREINRYSDITPIPQTPSFVAGVMNLRGKVIPVINLREKFHFEPLAPTKETCIVVIDSEASQMGVIVDAVSSVIDLTDKQIEKTPTLGEDNVEAFIIGLGKLDQVVVILVDVAKTLSKNHLKTIIQLASAEKSAA